MVFSTSICWSQTINLVEFASGLSNPVEIKNAGDDRLFVVQQNGMIKIVQSTGTVLPSDFLNISSKITFGGERGLLGLAFHPNYATNGYFFVFYNNTAGALQIARYSVSTTNPDVADPNSEKLILTIPKPFSNHNGGSMHFAPDGKLWISTGDGGGGGDPNNNSQNKNSLLGKMLRLDINTAGAYSNPADNPFIGITGADEIWSFGLRNAWKFSFDTTAGNVLIADVGQSAFEEINQMPISQAGINYGWRCYEGNTIYNANGCVASSTMTFPIAVYNHSGGKCSVTGGYVYRGSAFPTLAGKYIFADYCSQQIGILSSTGSITWSAPFTGNNFATFGEDQNKELYIAASNNSKVYKLNVGTLGVEESLQNEITIFPNPAKEKAFVKGLQTKNNTVEIVDLSGKKISETKLNSDGQFDVSHLIPGIYFVSVKSNGLKTYSQKLIIK